MIFLIGGVAAAGAGVGAVAEFFFDPVLGPERRLLVKNKLTRRIYGLRNLDPEALEDAVDLDTVGETTDLMADAGKHVHKRIGGLLP